jgi:hypothetical protein
MPVEHFKSAGAYRRWNAYRHIHGIPAPNLTAVVINGRKHTVRHSALSRPKAKAERRLKRVEKHRAARRVLGSRE